MPFCFLKSYPLIQTDKKEKRKKHLCDSDSFLLLKIIGNCEKGLLDCNTRGTRTEAEYEC